MRYRIEFKNKKGILVNLVETTDIPVKALLRRLWFTENLDKRENTEMNVHSFTVTGIE